MSLQNFDPRLMSRRTLVGLGAGIGALAAGCAAPEPERQESLNLDFSRPEDNLLAWIKLASSLEDGVETCGYYKGKIIATTGNDVVNTPLFGYEGFGMSRVTRLPDGRFENLHREVSYYTDLRSGDILETWYNPLIEETVKVYPVHNDPVNSHYAPIFKQTFGEEGASETLEFPFILPWIIIGDKAIVSFNVHPRWPSPLTKEQWPREYGGDWYKTTESFQIHTSLSALNDPNLMKAPATGAWTKEAPWIPWMLMGETPGRLFYITTVVMLNSTDELPQKIRAYTERHFPRHMHAPEAWTEPNMTSFETFAREAQPAPIVVESEDEPPLSEL